MVWRNRLAYRATGVAVVLVWSSCFVAIRGTGGAAPPLLYATLRALLAAGSLLVYAGLTGRLRPPAGSWPWLLGLGLVNTTLGLAGMCLSVGLAGAALPSVLVNSQALLVAPAAAWLFSEVLTWRRVVGLIVGTLGVVVTLAAGSNSPVVAEGRGLALALVATLGLAGGNLLMKKLGRWVDGLTAVAWQYALGGIALLGWSLAVEAPFEVDWTPRFVLGLAYLALVGSAATSLVWYKLLQQDGLAPLNSLTLLAPSASVALAWIFFREPIGPLTAVGIALALVGVALASAPGQPSRASTPHSATRSPEG